MDRRHFLATTTLGFPLIGSSALFAQESMKAAKPAQLAPELVKEFVRVGHNNLPEVQRMLKEQPGLLNASWDVGGGVLRRPWKARGMWVIAISRNT